MRTLEEWLRTPYSTGTAATARLVVTEAAELAATGRSRGIRPAGAGPERLREESSSGVLTVTVSPAFAAAVSRIDRFQTVWLPPTYVDTSSSAIDLLSPSASIYKCAAAGWGTGLTNGQSYGRKRSIHAFRQHCGEQQQRARWLTGE